MLAFMKDHQLPDDFSTSLPWLQHRMPIFSAGLNRWSRQRLNRESLHAELIVADLREFEIPDTVDLLVASYIIHLLPEPYTQVKTWQAKVRPGVICSISTRGRQALAGRGRQ